MYIPFTEINVNKSHILESKGAIFSTFTNSNLMSKSSFEKRRMNKWLQKKRFLKTFKQPVISYLYHIWSIIMGVNFEASLSTFCSTYNLKTVVAAVTKYLDLLRFYNWISEWFELIVVVFRPNIDTAKLRKYYTLYVVIQLLLIKCRLFELELYICTTEEQLNKLKCIAEVLGKGSFNHMNSKNKIMKKKTM